MPKYRFLKTPFSSRICRTVAGIRCTVYHCEESKPGCEMSESSALTFLAEIMRHPLWRSVRLGDSDEANVRNAENNNIGQINSEIRLGSSFMGGKLLWHKPRRT